MADAARELEGVFLFDLLEGLNSNVASSDIAVALEVDTSARMVDLWFACNPGTAVDDERAGDIGLYFDNVQLLGDVRHRIHSWSGERWWADWPGLPMWRLYERADAFPDDAARAVHDRVVFEQLAALALTSTLLGQIEPSVRAIAFRGDPVAPTVDLYVTLDPGTQLSAQPRRVIEWKFGQLTDGGVTLRIHAQPTPAPADARTIFARA